MTNKNVREVTLNIDASEAIRSLKAIQREARKATAALRELEAAQAQLLTEEAGVFPEPIEIITGGLRNG